MNPWTKVIEGTATGPTQYVDTPSGRAEVTALWSDTDGVGVSIRCSPDDVFSIEDVLTVHEAVLTLLMLDPPSVEAGVTPNEN